MAEIKYHCVTEEMEANLRAHGFNDFWLAKLDEGLMAKRAAESWIEGVYHDVIIRKVHLDDAQNAVRVAKQATENDE